MRRRNAVGLLSSTDLLNWRVNKVRLAQGSRRLRRAGLSPPPPAHTAPRATSDACGCSPQVLIYNRSPTIGFQYADFAISGDDILAVFRTALKTKVPTPLPPRPAPAPACHPPSPSARTCLPSTGGSAP